MPASYNMETRPYCDEDFIVLVEMALSCQDALIPEFRSPKKKKKKKHPQVGSANVLQYAFL